PSSYGRVAELRGREGTQRVANFFKVFPNVEVASLVPVVHKGQEVGDLDVVAVDLATRRGAVIEVKWPAPPDSVAEVAKTEREIRKGQKQLESLRRLIFGGEGEVDLPRNWPEMQEIEWTWLVVCKGHLAAEKSQVENDIAALSWEVLWSLPSTNLGQTLASIQGRGFLPTEGRDFRRSWQGYKVGGYRVKVETMESLS
ncbi:MAG TPA: hypothetical protein VEU29_06795, partial [Actinomycetota bacterium]|nr:hypothetical protein [Actinomycetota bacterium]